MNTISAFEYITVLISIVLGLGITQILTGVADLIHQSERVKVYWPHVIWIIVVLILHVQEWFETFKLRMFEPWRLATFLFIMLYPICLFILARLLFPFGFREKIIDLKEFYFHTYPKIFLFVVFLSFISMGHNIFFLNMPFSEQILQLFVFSTFLFITVNRFNQEWIHQTLSILMLTIVIATVFLGWDEWLIMN
jgi:hypothetical protein